MYKIDCCGRNDDVVGAIVNSKCIYAENCKWIAIDDA